MKNKLAIFIGGPYRYLDLVIRNIDNIMDNNGLDYDYFIHIWKEDLSETDKKRINGSQNLDELKNHKKVKILLFQEPYTKEFFERKYGNRNNTHSVLNGILGMFMSMDLLCKSLENLPDKDMYTNILRLRTDILIMNKDVFNNICLTNNQIYIADNPYIPTFYLSDHIMMANRKTFYRFWKFKNIDKIYKRFKKGNYNPEGMLWKIKAKNYFYFKMKRYRFVNLFKRFVDYQIVYYPIRHNDPEVIKEMIQFSGVNGLYLNFDTLDKEKLIDHYNKYNNEKINNYSKLKHVIVGLFGEEISKRVYNYLRKKK